MDEDATEGPVVCVSREEEEDVKTGRATGPSDVSLKLNVTSGGIGIQVMAEISYSPRWIWDAS